MLSKTAMRNLLENDCNGDLSQFSRRMSHYMGLSDRQGNHYRDSNDARQLRNPTSPSGKAVQRFKPSEFSLRSLAESIFGDNYQNELKRIPAAMLMQEAMGGRDLREDNGAGANMGSAFANINAFTGVTAGLLEVAILEQWQMPNLIGGDLAPDEPTKLFEGRKTIGVSRIGDQAEERLPGMPTKRVKLGERWITQPRTHEFALSCEVTQEAVYLDLTSEVLEEAGNVGAWLAYRKELRIIDAFIGVTNTYNYKGTAYNTFIAAGYFDNSFSNNLLHWDNVQAALLKFRDMKDPETNTRVQIEPKNVLVNLEKRVMAESIFGVLAGGPQYRDAPGDASNPQQINVFTESPYKGRYKILDSSLVFQRMTDADGLNLTTTNAGKRWYMWDPGFMRYATNWGLRTQTAAPTSQVDMIDRGVIMFTKADERGVPMVKEPRKIVENKA